MAEIWFLKFSYNGFCEKIQTSFGKALKISIQFFFHILLHIISRNKWHLS